jgi:hypothetical protein
VEKALRIVIWDVDPVTKKKTLIHDVLEQDATPRGVSILAGCLDYRQTEITTKMVEIHRTWGSLENSNLGRVLWGIPKGCRKNQPMLIGIQAKRAMGFSL